MALRNNSNPMAGKPAGNFVYRRFKLSFPSVASEATRKRLPVNRLTESANFEFSDTTKVVLSCISKG